MIELLTEEMMKDLLRKESGWKEQEDWWSGGSERWRNAPFGYDVNVTKGTEEGTEDNYQVVVYRADVDMESGEIMMSNEKESEILSFVVTIEELEYRTYCIMCLKECVHVIDKEGNYTCPDCGSLPCDGIVERDMMIQRLTRTNKELSRDLKHTQESQN